VTSYRSASALRARSASSGLSSTIQTTGNRAGEDILRAGVGP
jgi:hypothetical protein